MKIIMNINDFHQQKLKLGMILRTKTEWERKLTVEEKKWIKTVNILELNLSKHITKILPLLWNTAPLGLCVCYAVLLYSHHRTLIGTASHARKFSFLANELQIATSSGVLSIANNQETMQGQLNCYQYTSDSAKADLNTEDGI